MKVRFIGIVFLGLIMSIGASGAHATLITFDDVTAPADFNQTIRLTDAYAGVGVHFAGPGGLDGGAILNQNGNFGVNALSGLNFLV